MHDQTSAGVVRKTTPYGRTATPGIYKRGSSYTATWYEEKKRRSRAFPTYEAACAFRRDYVLPYRSRDTALPPAVAVPGKRDTGWVYVMQTRGSDAWVKIGWSRDLKTRFRDLNAQHPQGLDLVAFFPGDRGLEKLLHKRFAHRNLRAEWFSREVLAEFQMLLASILDDRWSDLGSNGDKLPANERVLSE